MLPDSYYLGHSWNWDETMKSFFLVGVMQKREREKKRRDRVIEQDKGKTNIQQTAMRILIVTNVK